MRILLSILILFSFSSSSANDFSGIWATDCNSSKQLSTLYITRSTNSKDALYRVGHPRVLSKPTPIIGDKDFDIINKDKIKHKKIELNRCIKITNPKYEPVPTNKIKKLILGKWSKEFHLKDGKKKSISNKKYGLPDFDFLDNKNVLIGNLNKTVKVIYKINKDIILFKIEEGQSFKVQLINETELHITFEKKPSAGIIIFHKQAG